MVPALARVLPFVGYLPNGGAAPAPFKAPFIETPVGALGIGVFSISGWPCKPLSISALVGASDAESAPPEHPASGIAKHPRMAIASNELSFFISALLSSLTAQKRVPDINNPARAIASVLLRDLRNPVRIVGRRDESRLA